MFQFSLVWVFLVLHCVSKFIEWKHKSMNYRMCNLSWYIQIFLQFTNSPQALHALIVPHAFVEICTNTFYGIWTERKKIAYKNRKRIFPQFGKLYSRKVVCIYILMWACTPLPSRYFKLGTKFLLSTMLSQVETKVSFPATNACLSIFNESANFSPHSIAYLM